MNNINHNSFYSFKDILNNVLASIAASAIITYIGFAYTNNKINNIESFSIEVTELMEDMKTGYKFNTFLLRLLRVRLIETSEYLILKEEFDRSKVTGLIVDRLYSALLIKLFNEKLIDELDIAVFKKKYKDEIRESLP